MTSPVDTDGGGAHRADNGVEAQAGQVGGIEVLPFALLVFVVGSLLLVNAWAVIDAKMAASAAARETARTFSEIPAGMSVDEGWSRANRAGAAAFSAYGIPANRTELRPASGVSPLRCSRIVVEATVTVPGIVLPWVGGFGDGFVVHARHSELVDPYRSGLEGEGCG